MNPFPILSIVHGKESQKIFRDDPFQSSLAILPYTHPKQKKETFGFFRVVLVIRAGFRKGAKPTGNVLNAVIVARQLYNGTFRKAAVAAEQA